jgi:two-component system chemotaxis response regulator CheB
MLVLIADDSPIFAEVLAEVLAEDRDITVAGIAGDGARAVAMARALRPDVMVMDVVMPVLDGFEAVTKIMAEHPLPVLMMTGDARGKTGELGFEALRRGAVDLMLKPAGWPFTPDQRRMIRDRVRAVARVATRGGHARSGVAGRCHGARREREDRRRGDRRIDGRAGRARDDPPRVAGGLPGRHRDRAARLARVRRRARAVAGFVVPPARDDRARRRRVPAGQRAHRPGPRSPGDRSRRARAAGLRAGARPAPAVGGRAVRVARRGLRPASLGVVLTGMGEDGARGLVAMRRAGALTLAQDEASCVVYGMPKAALLSGGTERMVPLDRIAAALCEQSLLSRTAGC